MNADFAFDEKVRILNFVSVTILWLFLVLIARSLIVEVFERGIIMMFIADFQMIQLINKKCVSLCVRAREGANERKRGWREKKSMLTVVKGK